MGGGGGAGEEGGGGGGELTDAFLNVATEKASATLAALRGCKACTQST